MDELQRKWRRQDMFRGALIFAILLAGVALSYWLRQGWPPPWPPRVVPRELLVIGALALTYEVVLLGLFLLLPRDPARRPARKRGLIALLSLVAVVGVFGWLRMVGFVVRSDLSAIRSGHWQESAITYLGTAAVAFLAYAILRPITHWLIPEGERQPLRYHATDLSG